MTEFWAKFIPQNGEVFRMDTRVYLSPVTSPSDSDYCLGAVVGKNPGSARKSSQTEELQPIELSGDKLLPTVRNVVRKAFSQAALYNTPQKLGA